MRSSSSSSPVLQPSAPKRIRASAPDAAAATAARKVPETKPAERAEDLVLEFGKHRGTALSEVDIKYLLWLAGLRLDRDGEVHDLVDEVVENIWGNAESLRHECGRCPSQAKHLPDCYSFCLGGSREETKHKLLEAVRSTSATFRDAEWLQSWVWVMDKHPEAVARARELLQGKCYGCGGKLVPIGRARANGKAHDDWPSRCLHMKCWKEMQSN